MQSRHCLTRIKHQKLKNNPIYLSPPSVDELDEEALLAVLRSGWVAPVGPAINVFEQGLCTVGGYRHVTALTSGTAALHLAVRLAGVTQGDSVIVGTFTFVAAANAVTYMGGVPIFVDSERTTWNIDPDLLEERLALADRKNEKVKAVIVTHLNGMPSQIEKIASICERYRVVLIEDAAQSLGSRIGTRWLGGYGRFGVLSFNGNKIITTSGGGALISDQNGDAQQALFLSQQAKEESDCYHHKVLGYNYRLSNVLAALGVSQLQKIDTFIKCKRAIYSNYETALLDCEVFDFLREPVGYFSNRWLSTLLIKEKFIELLRPNDIINALKAEDIEARRLWKPLHMQPLYHDCEFVGSGVAEGLFDSGLCLPSGVALSIRDQQRVMSSIKLLLMRRGLLE